MPPVPTPLRRWLFCRETRRDERGVLIARERGATPYRAKITLPLRDALQKEPCGVARRSFRVTKLLSSRLAWLLLGWQRGGAGTGGVAWP